MRAKPDMKPWVHTDKSRMSSVGAALTELVLALRCGCAAPTGLNKCVPMINPGLAPWAMKMYRPCRAPLRLPNQLLGYFNVLALVRGWHPCEATAKCGARIILAPPFYQFLFSTLGRDTYFYRDCLVNGRTGKRI